jgi:competence protein CoiA
MLCAIQQSKNESVIADSQLKADGPFLCPECKKIVSLRKSIVRTSHFAHKASPFCRYGVGESEAHRRCKKEIYESLLRHPNVTKLALERSLKTVRPDISAYINGIPVAIEVQLSVLSLETIAYRTAEYARKGIYVLWLAQWTPYLDAERYSPRLWEKWIHAAYFGRVYYWTEGLCVVPYRFLPYLFRSQRGEAQRPSKGRVSGNHSSRRYRSPFRGNTLHLTTDFIPLTRNGSESKIIKITSSKLYVEKTNKNQELDTCLDLE